MDIANMVLFLCSDKAGFITGENICIDGGMTYQMIYHSAFSLPEVHTIYGLLLPSECDRLENGTTCCNASRMLAQSVPTCLFLRTIPKFGL